METTRTRHAAWLTSTPATYACSPECRAIHMACLGCGVLSGPDHFHLLQDGYCRHLVTAGDTMGTVSIVPLFNACWSQWQAGLLSAASLARTA